MFKNPNYPSVLLLGKYTINGQCTYNGPTVLINEKESLCITLKSN